MDFFIFLCVVYGLLLLALPIWTIILSSGQAKLRRQLNELIEENAKQHAALQRAVGQLQSKMAAAPADAATPAQKPVAPVPQQVPVPRSFPAVPIPPKPVVSPSTPPAQTIEKKPEAARPPEQKPLVPEQKPSAPVPPPVAAPPTPSMAKPPEPIAPKPVIPAPPRITPPAPTVPPHVPVSPPPPTHVSTSAAARVSSSAPTSSLRVPSAPSTPSVKRGSSIEELLGANWFVKIGIFMLVIGVALLGKLVLRNIGPGGTAAIVFAVAFALLGGGIALEKRERYKLFGRIAIGGGWALLFFATWAVHFLPAMHVVDSSVLDAILMLLAAVAMGAHTLRYKSQLVTGFAFLVAYATIGVSQDTVYSLSAGVMLAIGLVAIVLKMRWYELEVFGILSSYLNHLYWLYTFLGIQGAHGRSFPEYNTSLALLFFYWLIFRVSYVARGIKTDFEEHISTVAAVLNTLLLLALMKFQSVQPELAYLGLFAVGALEFSAAQLSITRKRRRAFVLLSILGAALMVAAVPARYSGYPVATLWIVGAEVFLSAGIIFKEVVFRRIGLFIGLLVGIDLLFFNFRPLVEWRSSHGESPFIESGVHFAFCALVFYINSLFVSSRWKDSFSDSLDRRLLDIQSYLGSFAAASAAWALSSYDWTAVVFAALILALAALNRRLESPHLPIQYGLLGLLTLFRVFLFNLHADAPAHTHISTRLITLPLLGAAFYATAKLSLWREDQGQRLFRALFSFAGAGMFAALIWFEGPEMWIASLFLLGGILVALPARRWNLLHLSAQEHLFAAAAVLQTIAYNFHAPGSYGPISMRLVTVSLVAAGLYAISRRATTEDAPHSTIVAYLHTTAATFLLALLMWYEVKAPGWLAPLLALFALVLTLVDRRFQLNDLRWQAHALAAITMVRCISVNIYSNELWHGISVRLISLALVAVIFYAMALLIRMPEELRVRDFHHIYSWSASFLGSLLLWYELDALGRAVGLAAFGLVLFEYGFLRKIAQFRYQAYVAFLAAFARIFFGNLTAGEPGELFGPRMYTVLPLALIFLFVYAQLSGEEAVSQRKERFRSANLVAYLGSATLAALFYFQFDPEWVVVSYAALAFALFAAAWALQREVFLHQGLLVTLGVFARGMAHNLFGSSYFTGADWRGRYLVLTIAVAILVAALFFAFRLREAYKTWPHATQRGRIVAALVGRPELVLFFTSVILVTVMLGLKNSESMITVSWGIEAFVIVALALIARERTFLHAGFGLLLLCAGKTFAMDMWRLDLLGRTITFIGVGLAITVVSLLYIRYQDHLKRYL